jgi:hypothetical protein
LGVVEGPTIYGLGCIFGAGRPVFLDRHKISLCRDGCDLGAKVFNLWLILYHLPYTDMVFYAREYVYAKNSHLYDSLVYDYWHSVILALVTKDKHKYPTIYNDGV